MHKAHAVPEGKQAAMHHTQTLKYINFTSLSTEKSDVNQWKTLHSHHLIVTS